MGIIKPIKHYAIPPKCQNDNTGCPFTNVVGGAMPKSWETRYDELELAEGHLLKEEQTGGYTQQGGTTDGTYIYRALVEHDDQPTKLQKLDMTGMLVLEKVNTSYGHANDMTYCEKDGLLYIAHSSSTSIVYKVDPETLELVDTINIGPAIWGIAYNPVDELFVLGLVGSAFLSVYNYNFEFMYRIKMDNAFSGMVRQGLACTENYIFVSLDNAYGTILDNDKGSRIMVYTWNAMFIKSYHLAMNEIEFTAVNGSELIIGTYEGRDETGTIKTCRLYKLPFDLYPEQTIITGRPTDVSGGLNNLQRLPEGTMVRLFNGTAKTGTIKLNVPARLHVDEDGPFRYLKIRFKGANQRVVDYFLLNAGTLCLSETDITAAVEDTTIRIREARLTFNVTTQSFTFEDNFIEEVKYDKSEDKIIVTKTKEEGANAFIEIGDIWGVV